MNQLCWIAKKEIKLKGPPPESTHKVGVNEEQWPEGSCDPDVVLDPNQYHEGLEAHHYQNNHLYRGKG